MELAIELPFNRMYFVNFSFGVEINKYFAQIISFKFKDFHVYIGMETLMDQLYCNSMFTTCIFA